MISLTVLGFGGWLSNPFYGQSGYLIQGEGLRILLDAGEGTYRSLRMCEGLSTKDIDYVILTHPHGDHVLGIPTMLQIAKYEGVKVRILAPQDTIESVRGIMNCLKAQSFLGSAELKSLPYQGTVSLDRITITTVKAIHPPPSISLILEVGDARIAYSGDTSPNEEFLKAAVGSDILIHEVSASSEMAEEALKYGHTSSSDLPKILSIARPKLFLPTHYPFSLPAISCDVEGVRCLTPALCGRYVIKN